MLKLMTKLNKIQMMIHEMTRDFTSVDYVIRPKSDVKKRLIKLAELASDQH